MIISCAIILSFIMALILPFAPEWTYDIVKGEFITYLIIIIVDILNTKRLTILHVWIFSYIYIILSEMLIVSWTDFSHEYTMPIFFYLLANNLVILGYKLFQPKYNKKNTSYVVRNSNFLIASLIVLVVVYMVFNFEQVALTYYFGRVVEFDNNTNPFFTGLINSFGILAPCFIGYYFKHVKQKSVIYSIILSLPIFIYQFILATRFKLLFTILPFIFVTGISSPSLNNTKKNILFVLILVIFSFTSSILKENRNVGQLNSGESTYYENVYADEDNMDFYQTCAYNMSPEGIIYMAKKADEYFASNPLLYGRETAFLLYFWVPRSIWPDKPAQLGSWLIRKTEDVSDAHSTSSGFMGELRADFGWFSLIFALFIGLLLKLCDQFIYSFKNNEGNIDYIIAAVLYCYFFFFVRSPITASTVLIGEFITFYIIKRVFFEKQEIK